MHFCSCPQNNRKVEGIARGSKDYKHQESLAAEGHSRYINARGGQQRSGARPSTPLTAHTARDGKRGEKRGLSDMDESDHGLKMSHMRYVEQTTQELTETFQSKPTKLVNHYVASTAGEQGGRTIGSFMLHMQHEVSCPPPPTRHTAHCAHTYAQDYTHMCLDCLSRCPSGVILWMPCLHPSSRSTSST